MTEPTTAGAGTDGNFSPFPPSVSNENGLSCQPVLNIDEPDYIVCGQANTAIPVEWKTFNILLKDIIPDSIFSIDQDLYIQKIIYLRITFNPITSIGAASLTDIGNNAGTSLGAVWCILSNLSLSVYTQANPIIEAMIKTKFMSQQEIIIPDINANW